MIKSMTGFASVSLEHELAAIGVTVRSVNHRHLDVQVRLSPLLAKEETELRALVQRWVARGRVELAITTRWTRSPSVEVTLNAALVAALSAAVDQAQQRGLVSGGLTTSDVLRFPHAVVVQEQETAETDRVEIAAVVSDVVADALRQLDEMRTREGEFLRVDLDTKIVTVTDLVERLAVAAQVGEAGLVARLTARVDELRASILVEEAAVAQEVTRLVARSDVSEELTRLRGHLAHREVNTLGAKIAGPAVSGLIVAAKAELEKLREQIQNVE